MKRLFWVLVLLINFFILGVDVVSAKSTVFFSAVPKVVEEGDRINIEVRVSSDESINAVSGVVSFPTDLLSLISISRNASIINIWTEEPKQVRGRIPFEGVIMNPGFVGTSGLVMRATFEAKKAGTVSLGFAEGAVLANDGRGTNLLASLLPVGFKIVAPKPVFEPPNKIVEAPKTVDNPVVSAPKIVALPVITEYTPLVAPTEGLYVKGKGEPNSLTKIVFKDVSSKSLGERFIMALQPNKNRVNEVLVENDATGAFEYKSAKNILAGVYNATPFLVEEETRVEKPGFGVQLLVDDSKIVKYLVVAINVLALLIPVVGLIVIIYFIPWYSFRRMRLLKKKMLLEEKKLESSNVAGGYVASFILLILAFSFASVAWAQNRGLLTPEEALWLESRNNTIVVYPEKNDPPFSYTSASGNLQGLAIDYMELVAEKVGAQIQYLNPQAKNQILVEFQNGKGDVVPGLTETSDKNLTFLFTDHYVEVPTVIVVRKDFDRGSALTLGDFNGKRVSVVAGSALENYVRQNYPRVVVEDVTDDEVSLQQIVLGEVDAGVMDVASLSYFLSKQVLNSVKIAGNTGYEYKPAFAISKDKGTLQSILEKGMTQITTNERSLLNDKWIVVPGEEKQDNSVWAKIDASVNLELLYIVFGLGVLLVIAFLMRFHRHDGVDYTHLEHDHKMSEEVKELEQTNSMLLREIRELKEDEEKLAQKLDTIAKKE